MKKKNVVGIIIIALFAIGIVAALIVYKKVQTVLEVTGRELGWQVYRTSHTVHPAEMEAGKAAEAEEYPNAADYIYLGIVHDTNAFQRADESIMKAATKLLELGVDHRRIIQTRQIDTLEDLEKIWDEYQVYSKDELNMVDDRVELSGNEKE